MIGKSAITIRSLSGERTQRQLCGARQTRHSQIRIVHRAHFARSCFSCHHDQFPPWPVRAAARHAFKFVSQRTPANAGPNSTSDTMVALTPRASTSKRAARCHQHHVLVPETRDNLNVSSVMGRGNADRHRHVTQCVAPHISDFF